MFHQDTIESVLRSYDSIEEYVVDKLNNGGFKTVVVDGITYKRLEDTNGDWQDYIDTEYGPVLRRMKQGHKILEGDFATDGYGNLALVNGDITVNMGNGLTGRQRVELGQVVHQEVRDADGSLIYITRPREDQEAIQYDVEGNVVDGDIELDESSYSIKDGHVEGVIQEINEEIELFNTGGEIRDALTQNLDEQITRVVVEKNELEVYDNEKLLKFLDDKGTEQVGVLKYDPITGESLIESTYDGELDNLPEEEKLKIGVGFVSEASGQSPETIHNAIKIADSSSAEEAMSVIGYVVSDPGYDSASALLAQSTKITFNQTIEYIETSTGTRVYTTGSGIPVVEKFEKVRIVQLKGKPVNRLGALGQSMQVFDAGITAFNMISVENNDQFTPRQKAVAEIGEATHFLGTFLAGKVGAIGGGVIVLALGLNPVSLAGIGITAVGAGIGALFMSNEINKRKKEIYKSEGIILGD